MERKRKQQPHMLYNLESDLAALITWDTSETATVRKNKRVETMSIEYDSTKYLEE